MKNCTKCNKNKLLTEFHKAPQSKDGHQTQCKICRNANNTSRNIANPLKRKDELLRSKFGITIEQYNQLFTNQNGCCAICKRHQSNFKYALHVDHNHTSNKVRGLLCQPCNTGIGLLQDSRLIIQAADLYLAKINII